MSIFKRKQKISFKRATINDVVEFLRIEKSAIGLRVYSGISDKQEAVEEIQNNVMYFIQKNGINIGTMQYEVKDDNWAYLSGIVVDSKFQGQGVGRRALEWLLNNDLKNFKKIDLVTHPRNTRAIMLYLSLGFIITSWKDNYYNDGEPRIVLVREK
jgi:ribosomal protein S18 acetylase RimI-like enzyme